MKKDICPICGKEINLALPHAYSRELSKPVHRDCLTTMPKCEPWE